MASSCPRAPPTDPPRGNAFRARPARRCPRRRGGYAVGLASGGGFTASKVGSRHVQSRTAAGGWSQQRFARRRGSRPTSWSTRSSVMPDGSSSGTTSHRARAQPAYPVVSSSGETARSCARCSRRRPCGPCAGCRRASSTTCPTRARRARDRAPPRPAVRVALTEPPSPGSARLEPPPRGREGSADGLGRERVALVDVAGLVALVNHVIRASAEPWVHDSGVTRPCIFSWIRSSPTADAADSADLMSCSVIGLSRGCPWRRSSRWRA